MSATGDDRTLPDLDEVRKAYRDAGFDDEPPEHVDAFIRAAARRESKRRINDYLPSLAMAATIVLALGLVLRLTLPGRNLIEPETAPDSLDESATFQERAAPLENEAAPAAATVQPPEAAAEQLVQDSAAQPEDAAAPARASAAAAEESAAAALALDAVDAPRQEGVASTAMGRMAAPASVSVPCTAAERGDANLWLECIGAQIDAGLLDAARADLAAFRLAFDDYPLPANIVDALEP